MPEEDAKRLEELLDKAGEGELSRAEERELQKMLDEVERQTIRLLTKELMAKRAATKRHVAAAG